MDKNTFGIEKCSENLASIIDIKYPQLRKVVTTEIHKTCRLFYRAYYGVLPCKVDGEADFRKTVLKWAFLERKTAIQKRDFPKEVESHTLCVITAKYRKYINQIWL